MRITAKSGVVIHSERRPTVDRAWVVCATHGEMLIDLEVVEGGEKFVGPVFENMV